jgi:hypothetical protein
VRPGTIEIFERPSPEPCPKLSAHESVGLPPAAISRTPRHSSYLTGLSAAPTFAISPATLPPEPASCPGPQSRTQLMVATGTQMGEPVTRRRWPLGQVQPEQQERSTTRQRKHSLAVEARSAGFAANCYLWLA